MPYTYTAEQWLPYPIDLVFAFFANPDNLPRLMPAWQKPRIDQAEIAPPPPYPAVTRRYPGRAAGAGTRMTLTFRPIPFSPIRLSWDAEISEFAWNDHFCDIQLRGPFAAWKHCHHLTPESRNGQPGTLLRDHVEYTMHFGPLGRIAHSLGGRRQIRSIFTFRHRRTAELLPQFAAANS